MEGKHRAMLFLLLVTISSVTGNDFTFSKEVYDAILTMYKKLGISIEGAERIKFLQMDHEEAFVLTSRDELQNRGILDGIHISAKNPKTVKAGISGVKNPGSLNYVSIVFSKISHGAGETIYGNLMICFEDFMKSSSESCLSAFLFSPAKTSEDEKYAKKIAEELDPLSDKHLDAISDNKPLKWALSCLQKVLVGDVKQYVYTADTLRGQSVFALKPIIVNENLLKRYFKLANPQGSVPTVGIPSDEQPTIRSSSIVGHNIQ